MSTQALIIDTGAVCLVRAGLFYLCRRFLLQTLYSDLRHITDLPPSSLPSALSQPPTPMHHLQPERLSLSLSRSSSVEELSLLPLPISAGPEGGWTFRPRPSLPLQGDRGAVDLSSADPSATPSLVDRVIEHAATQLTHSALSRGVFGTVFAETGTLFVLVGFQATGVLHEAGRVMNFRGSLLASSLLILLACPLLEIHLLTFARPSPSSLHTTTTYSSGRLLRPTPWKLLLVFAPFLLYLFVLFQIPLPEGLTKTIFDSFLARLVLLGVMILALLSSLASLHSASTLWGSLRPGPIPKPSDLLALEHSLSRLRSDLSERQRDLARIEEAASEGAGRSAWGRWTGLGKQAAEERAVRGEVRAMRGLEDKMARELDVLRERRARAEYGKTLRGRVWNAVTAVFGVYCTFRIISVLGNILLPLFSPRPAAHPGADAYNIPDLVTYLLALVVAHLPVVEHDTIDVQLLGRQISLVLVGVVVGGNVRFMMRHVAKALRVTSRNMLASFLLLVLTQIMGMYLLSTLVQLRSSVPLSSFPGAGESVEEPLFSLLPRFEVFGRVFDWTFLLGGVGWGVWRLGGWFWLEG